MKTNNGPSVAELGARAVRSEAAERIRDLVGGNDRIVVTGAGGWFGETTVALLVRAFGPTVLSRVLATGSHARTIRRDGYAITTETPTLGQIAAFEPNHVINCAFPTRDKVKVLGWDRYVATATTLSSQWLSLLQLPSVQTAITFSSGASLLAGTEIGEWNALSNPYGYLKRVEEDLTIEVARHAAVGTTVLRAWSVSGAFVGRPSAYAFSDLITQARSGHIKVASDHAVWRRYCGIDDAIAVAWSLASAGDQQLISTGGTLTEIGDLAGEIARLVGGGCIVERPALLRGIPNKYFDLQDGFADAIAKTEFRPAGLAEQILDVAHYLPP